MATNTNVELVFNAKLFAEKYYQAVIDNDSSFLNDDPNTPSVLVSLNDLRTRIRCAIEIGNLKVRGRHSQIYMQPSQDAFNTGIVKLQDFCDWAETIGLDDCPKTAYELALFFKMPKAIEIANSIVTQAPENETKEQRKVRYEAVILKNNGNKTKAATELGISRALLYKTTNKASNKSDIPTANNTFPIQK